jgi:predicted nucleotidyltransferase
METAKAVTDFLTRVTEWAASQPTIPGVALVGSHARGEARPDSDIDVVLLCEEPRGFLTEPSWIYHFGEVETCQTEDWGVVTSLRVRYRHGLEVEFGMTILAWAALPIDPGTKHVVSQGMRILFDRMGMLGRLRAAVATA